MKKLLLLFFLITLCACSDLLSKDYLIPKQYRIREGMVCEHEQTVLFPQKDGTAIEVKLGEPVIVAMAEEAYTSHNTIRLDVEGTVKKLLTTDYVQAQLKIEK